MTLTELASILSGQFDLFRYSLLWDRMDFYSSINVASSYCKPTQIIIIIHVFHLCRSYCIICPCSIGSIVHYWPSNPLDGHTAPLPHPSTTYAHVNMVLLPYMVCCKSLPHTVNNCYGFDYNQVCSLPTITTV